MKKPKTIIKVLTAAILISTLVFAAPTKDHPQESNSTGTVNLTNWQQTRGYGLRNFQKIARDLIAVNAEHIRPLKVEHDYKIKNLPSVKALTDHPALDAMIIVKDGKIQLEHYANGMTSTSLHSCQSSTKTIVNLLAGQAVTQGKLDLDANVEKYIPDIGTGFKGRTVADVLAMNVKHELDEIAAYTGKGLELFEKDESSIGFLPSNITDMNRREFLKSLKAGNEDGTNENRTGKYFYATANTDLAGWIVERATGISSQQAVRQISHAIGAENTVYMVTDRTGFPIVGGGYIMTARDFARYGILLMSGGKSVTGENLGGGPEFVSTTMTKGTVSMGVEGWHYINSAYASKWGLGHAGWGGQWIFADPQSKTVIAVFSGLMGFNPADTDYAKLLLALTEEVIDYQRKK